MAVWAGSSMGRREYTSTGTVIMSPTLASAAPSWPALMMADFSSMHHDGAMPVLHMGAKCT